MDYMHIDFLLNLLISLGAGTLVSLLTIKYAIRNSKVESNKMLFNALVEQVDTLEKKLMESKDVQQQLCDSCAYRRFFFERKDMLNNKINHKHEQ